MILFSTIIQEGQTASQKIDALEERLRGIGQDILGESPDDAQFRWTTVDKGRGFTAGAPSKSSLTVAVVPDGIEESTRVEMMTAMCGAFVDITECTVNDVMSTVIEKSASAGNRGDAIKGD